LAELNGPAELLGQFFDEGPQRLTITRVGVEFRTELYEQRPERRAESACSSCSTSTSRRACVISCGTLSEKMKSSGTRSRHDCTITSAGIA
jgi:hypothetical protein